MEVCPARCPQAPGVADLLAAAMDQAVCRRFATYPCQGRTCLARQVKTRQPTMDADSWLQGIGKPSSLLILLLVAMVVWVSMVGLLAISRAIPPPLAPNCVEPTHKG